MYTVSIVIGLMIVIPSIIVTLPHKVEEKKQEQETISTSNLQAIDVPQVEVAVKRSHSEKVEKVPLETYVMSVVASEMPADFELEALKAQAVAARTYIVNHLLHQPSPDETITDTTDHQVYKNEEELKQVWGTDFTWKWEKVSDAVNATENIIITYDNKPITPTFFSMSNGFTEDAENYWGNELPYLKSVESKWEKSLPNFTDQTVFLIDEVGQKLGIPVQSNADLDIKMNRTPSERVKEIMIGDKQFTGKEVREKLNLRSNDFSIQQKDNHLIFTTKGYGHGVGMSQYGANGMALEGKTFHEILTYYYQGIELSAITETVPSLVAK